MVCGGGLKKIIEFRCRMSRLTAQLISIIFHPALLQLSGYVFIWYWYPNFYHLNEKGLKYAGGAVLLFTWGIPLFMYAALKLSGRIGSLALEERTERNIPYLITFMCYLGCWRLFQSSHLWGILSAYTLASGVVVGVCGWWNLKTKISAHTAGCGGLISLVIFSYFFGQGDLRTILAICFIISGLVYTARKSLHAHTDRELILGFSSGFLSGLPVLFAAYIWG